MESGGSKAQGGSWGCPGAGIPGHSTRSRERRWVSEGIHPSAHAPCALASASGRTQTLCTAQFASGASSPRSPKRWRSPRPGCWDLRPCQPGKAVGAEAPGDPTLGCRQRPVPPAGTPGALCPTAGSSTPEPTPPPGGGDPRRPLRIFPARTLLHEPAARVPGSAAAQAAAGPAPSPRGAGSAAQPRSPASRRRRRTRSCRRGPRTGARGSWACGAPAARRCPLQPSSPCRCRPARRTGRPGAAWPRRAGPSGAESVCPRRRRRRGGRRGDRSGAAAGERAAGRARQRDPGASGRGWGTLLFLIQWRIAGPAAASGGAPGSASRSARGGGAGEGPWAGRAPRRARGGGRALGRRSGGWAVGSGARAGQERLQVHAGGLLGGSPTGVRLRGSNSEAAAAQRAGIGGVDTHVINRLLLK